MNTIAIAEDHQSLIDGIELLLRYEERYEIVGVANDGEKLLEIVRRKRPKVVLTDIKMPKIDGIAVTKIIKKELPDTKIIAFTMFAQEEAIRQMVQAGADGYLLKSSELKSVIKAVDEVLLGKKYFDPTIDVSFLENKPQKHTYKNLLSKTERDILRHIGNGKTSREIAEIRCSSVSTIDTHRKNMMRKLDLHGSGELYRYAVDKKYEFE